jgi:hypothetical protein
MGMIGKSSLEISELAHIRYAADDSDPVVGMPDIIGWAKELEKRLGNGELRGSRKEMDKQ